MRRRSMNKMNLERAENKISKLKSALQKTKSLITNLENKKSTLENEIGELEKEANIMRLENLNSQLKVAGVDLKSVDIAQVVHLLGEKFHIDDSKSEQTSEQSKDEILSEEDNDGKEDNHELIENPFSTLSSQL
jgi:hypothetical protein